MLEYTGNLGHERQLTAYQLGSESSSDDRTSKVSNDQTTSTTTALEPINNESITKNNEIDVKEEITLLDTLAVERDRGITVKASAASMLYHHPSLATNKHGWILINMVDTPGHADFGMEVSKSLDSVEGAVLLFDAAQGVQAQTLSVYDKARMIGSQRKELIHRRQSENKIDREEEKEIVGVVGESNSMNEEEYSEGISILPALTKVDMPSSRPLEVALAVSDLMGFDPGEEMLFMEDLTHYIYNPCLIYFTFLSSDEILKTSARARIGIKDVSRNRGVCMYV